MKKMKNHEMMEMKDEVMKKNGEVAEKNEAEETGTMPDNLTGYLREINRVPLLTKEQERELSARVMAGQAMQERVEAGEISAEKARGVLQAGEQAQKQLVNANLRLVVTIAKTYQNRGLSLADLIQEGNLGLMKAAAKYDATTGNRFSTCAAWWIRQGISRAVTDQGRTIRLPANVYQKVCQMRKVRQELTLTLEREPTRQELAQKMRISERELSRLQNADQDCTSLDISLGDGDRSATLGDMVSGVSPIDQVEDRMVQDTLRQIIHRALETLEPRERLVLELRFGLSGNAVHTLEAVSQQLGLTRERVRQIELRALRRLRSGSSARYLEGFIA